MKRAKPLDTMLPNWSRRKLWSTVLKGAERSSLYDKLNIKLISDLKKEIHDYCTTRKYQKVRHEYAINKEW